VLIYENKGIEYLLLSVTEESEGFICKIIFKH